MARGLIDSEKRVTHNKSSRKGAETKMKIFLDNGQLILWTASINLLFAYLIFDSPLARRRNGGREERRVSYVATWYLSVALYSALLAVITRSLLDDAEFSNTTSVPGLLAVFLLAASWVIFPEHSLWAPQSRKSILFSFLSIFVAFSCAI